MKQTTSNLIFSVIFFCSIGLSAQSFASYDISFTSTWNSMDHGILPSNAHWSNLVGATHNANITFLEMGSMATEGIENVAELGLNTVFNSEVQNAIVSGNADQWFNMPFEDFAAITSVTLNDVLVAQEYSLLTLVSMIAPSPDWMIAVNSLNLWNTSANNWKESFTVDLFPYDTGTENGFGYSSNNTETIPQGVITNIAGATSYPFNTEKIGTLTLTLINVILSTDDFENNKPIKLYPNPSNTGKVTITNSSLLTKISVYDVLGKNVKQIDNINNKNNFILDVSDLNKGVYIVKLKTSLGNTESKKLLLN